MRKILAREELLKLPIGTVIAIKASNQYRLYGTISGLEIQSTNKEIIQYPICNLEDVVMVTLDNLFKVSTMETIYESRNQVCEVFRRRVWHFPYCTMYTLEQKDKTFYKQECIKKYYKRLKQIKPFEAQEYFDNKRILCLKNL